MSVIVRVGTAHDMPAISILADQVFRPGGTSHMAEEFPLLYSPHNASHWVVAETDGVIVSVIGAMIWPAVIAGYATRIACIGSVATHPTHRGQGLASRLLQAVEARLLADSVRVVMISGDLPLYERFGARAVGKVYWHSLSPGLPPQQYRIVPINPEKDAAVIARLYESKATRLGRTISDLQVLLRTQPLTGVERGIKIAQLVLQGDTPTSYAIAIHAPRKGREASRLSEWAGDPKGVLAGLRAIPDWPPAGLLVPVQPHDFALRGALADSPFTQTPVPWLAKIIDGEGLAQDLGRLWTERSSEPFHISSAGPHQYQILRGTSRWDIDDATLTEWVFGETQPVALADIWPIPALWPQGLNYI